MALPIDNRELVGMSGCGTYATSDGAGANRGMPQPGAME
jgi:hypothetical protein